MLDFLTIATRDKKSLVEAGTTATETPSVQINIVSNDNLEEALYDEEE